MSAATPGGPAPLRALIVDDEPPARARLRRLLAEIEGVTVAGEAGSAEAARRALETTPADVLLLDVQMPGEDGFQLLDGLRPRPAVVFVTAFDHYAVRAFEESATDYLLKPVRRERLAAALERVRQALLRPEALAQRLETLMAALGHAPGTEHLERFTVRSGLRQIILRVDEVLWFGAADKLVFAATATDRHYVNFTLDQLEQRLDPRRFARVHRSAIVQLDQAAALRPAFAGTYRLQLKDATRTELPVSRSRARRLRDRLGG